MSDVLFPLSIPYTTAAGVRIESLTLRRLQVKDLKAVRKVSAEPADWDDLLIARSSGFVPEDFDGMDLGDYLELQKRFQQLTGLAKQPQGADAVAGDAGEVVPLATE